MRSLPNIEVSKNDLSLILAATKSVGGEAVICHGFNSNTLYKLFLKPSVIGNAMFFHERDLTNMSDNKLNKLLKLQEISPENCVMPLSTISYNGKLIGYEMTYDQNDIAFSSPDAVSSWKDVIRVLQDSSDILRGFHKKNIIFGDIARRNILVNKKTGQVSFCDIDNICIAGHSFDVMSPELDYYVSICGIDDKADAYMHNLMTFETVGVDLDECRFDPYSVTDDFDEHVISLAKSIEEPQRFSGEYAIRYLKRR